LELRLVELVPKTDAEIDLEIAEGSALVENRWIRDKLLLPEAEMARAWSREPKDLDQACREGGLFCLLIGGTRWYPAAFLELDAGDVDSVCRVLRGLDASSAFIFWNRRQGSLRGQTLHQALRAGERGAVLQLARSFAFEHVHARGAVNQVHGASG